jgi:hypothetical protein
MEMIVLPRVISVSAFTTSLASALDAAQQRLVD